MNTIKYGLIAIIVSIGAMANGQQKQTLTLSQCREMAIKNSEVLKIAEENHNKAKGEKQAAKSAYLPNLAASATGLYNKTHIEQELYLPTQNFNLATGELEPNIVINPSTGQPVIGTDGNPLFNTYAYLPLDLTLQGGVLAGISAEQPIYTGGKIHTGNKMAAIGEKMAQTNIQLQEGQLTYKTDHAFYTYLATREKVKLASKYNQLLSYLVEVVENSVNSGMINKNELLKVQVRQNETAMQLQKAESGLKLSRMALCQLIGLELTTEIEVEDSLESTSIQLNSLSPPDAKNRIEHQLMEHQLELAKQTIKMVKSDYLPSAGISAGYNYYNIRLKDADNYSSDGFNLMGSLKIPITTFGERKGKIAVAKADYAIKQLELQQGTKLMQLEMEQARLNLLDAFTCIQLAGNTLENASENLKQSENNYKLGMETLANLLEAQAEWQKAYSNKIDALTDYKIKESRFCQLTNKL